jgi:hypothetical protein
MWTTGLKFTKDSDYVNKGADVLLISGCKNDQTSADAVEDNLPQGACTWAFLAALKKLAPGHKSKWEDLVALMRTELKSKGYSQIPQLSVESPQQLREIVDLIPQ